MCNNANVLYLLFSIHQVRADNIVLSQGDKKTFRGYHGVVVENKNVIRVEEVGSSFVVKGLSAGHSQLKLDSKLFEINVLSLQQEKSYKLLSQVVSQTMSLSVAIEGENVVVQGELLRWKDWNLLFDTCLSADCTYLFKAHINSSLKPSVFNKMSDIFKSFGIHQPNIDLGSGARVFISKDSDDLKGQQKFFAAFGMMVIKNSQSVDILPTIKVQITVAEVRREESLKYGLEWPDSYEAQILPSSTLGSEPLALIAHALEKNGFAKILASPNILCKSGKSAEFFAGGEFPIRVMNFRIHDVVWKNYGISLKVSPTADTNGRMSLSIETEVSNIDDSRTVDGIPALFTNKIQSHFDLTESRTIALSGLIKNETGNSAQGLPGLLHIPILGSLFSSRDFRENRSELVVFVRPEIVKN